MADMRRFILRAPKCFSSFRVLAKQQIVLEARHGLVAGRLEDKMQDQYIPLKENVGGSFVDDSHGEKAFRSLARHVRAETAACSI